MVLDHRGARFVVCGDQEQVDKVLEVQDRLPGIDHILYLDKRGMRKYDHSRMNALADIAAEGRPPTTGSRRNLTGVPGN